MNKQKILAVITTLVFATSILSIAVPSALSATFDPNMKQGSYGSYNWSGYEISGSSFTSVKCTFTVPTVTPTKGATTYVALWTGIDGFNDATVEQAGVMAVSNGKTVSYSAWYELYPAGMVTISSLTVKPSDTVTVSVTFAGVDQSGNDLFTISVADGAQSFAKTVATNGAVSMSSAEWIVERPAIAGSLTKLANFGTASFSGCAYTGTGLLPLNSITMVNKKGQILASPFGLVQAADGSYGFSVKYVRSN